MNCSGCGKKIPKIRLKALPNITTCVKCSTTEAKSGIVVWNKATPEVVVLGSADFERAKSLERYDGCNQRL